MKSNTNKISDGWKKTTLGEVVKLNYGKGLVATKRIKGNTPVYGSSGITGFHNKPLVNEKGLIIGRKGTVGSIYKELRPFYPIDTVYFIRKSDSNLNFDYLYYLLQTLRLDKRNGDSAVPGLNRNEAYSIPFIYPNNLSEQKAIAKILSSFEDKIELLRKQNETLEKTAQTIFSEWFGKYQVGDDLPEGWKVGRINSFIGELESGRRPKGGVGKLSSGVPSVGAESINGISFFDFSKTKYVSENFFDNLPSGIVKEYDIMVYKDGGTPGTFKPRFSMFGEGFPFERFCINEHVFRVQPKRNYQRFYLYLWLNSYFCKRQLKNIGGKAAIPGINSTDFKNLDFIIPDELVLKKLHLMVKNNFKKILLNNMQIQTLSKIRDVLLPKLMSGKIRVQ